MAEANMQASARPIFTIGRRTDAITAWREGNQPTMSELRQETIVNRNPEFSGIYLFSAEWYAGTGIGNRILDVMENRRLVAAEYDCKGRKVSLNLADTPSDLFDLKVPIMTFIPAHIDETQREVIITPVPGTVKLSPSAPETSRWCWFEDGVFEEVETATLKKLRDNEPLKACFPWINEKPSIGPAIVYGDGTGQGIGVYYPSDFLARAVRIERPTIDRLLR